MGTCNINTCQKNVQANSYVSMKGSIGPTLTNMIMTE